MILGGLRDGKPPAAVRQEAAGGKFVSANDIRRSPTTSDRSAEYEGVVGTLWQAVPWAFKLASKRGRKFHRGVSHTAPEPHAAERCDRNCVAN
jgi:hypothetical protein